MLLGPVACASVHLLYEVCIQIEVEVIGDLRGAYDAGRVYVSGCHAGAGSESQAYGSWLALAAQDVELRADALEGLA